MPIRIFICGFKFSYLDRGPLPDWCDICMYNTIQSCKYFKNTYQRFCNVTSYITRIICIAALACTHTPRNSLWIFTEETWSLGRKLYQHSSRHPYWPTTRSTILFCSLQLEFLLRHFPMNRNHCTESSSSTWLEFFKGLMKFNLV